MSKTGRQNYRRNEREQRTGRIRREHAITVRSVKRNPPDLRKLSRAVIALAMAEMEAEKAAAVKPETTSEEVSHDDA